MKRSKFTEAQIVFAIKQSETGTRIEEICRKMGISDEQVDRIIQKMEKNIKETVGNANLLLTSKKRALAEIQLKINRLEERLMNEVIEEDTFKKWMLKYKQDRSLLEEDIKYANVTSENHPLNTLKEVLPMLKNLRGIFQIATLPEKHALIKEVFKGKLAYENGTFRTAFINPVFESNIMKINEKGLLVIEKPPQIFGGVPPCTQGRDRTGTVSH
ncbi:transposase [Parapedobacter tibetensis]|uniref:transposase n=1 Tax=Parapedobacter tibetensis TaxID=2972951 RepID=UPI00214D8D84|nr:transposase [Parapedobacter tibetensis]